MTKRYETPEEVLALLRELTGQSVVISEAIARRAGLSPSDLEVLGTIAQLGPLTAGQLSELTGLSAAAVTGLIDRLERAGVAERRQDPEDRRRVLVSASAGSARVSRLYGSLGRDTLAALSERTPRELVVIAAFLREMYEIGAEHVARLGDGPSR